MCKTPQSQENYVEWTGNTEVPACSCQKSSLEVKLIIPGKVSNINDILRVSRFSSSEKRGI